MADYPKNNVQFKTDRHPPVKRSFLYSSTFRIRVRRLWFSVYIFHNNTFLWAVIVCDRYENSRAKTRFRSRLDSVPISSILRSRSLFLYVLSHSSISFSLALRFAISLFYLSLDYAPAGRNDVAGALDVDESLLDESDFNCVLCCGMFRNPVTTPCGHTYCMDCLEHNFDYSFHCPLCLTALPPVSSA